MPTSYAAEPLKSEMFSGDELPPVWPWKDGDTRGIALEIDRARPPDGAM
jgi:hypothetical protein